MVMQAHKPWFSLDMWDDGLPTCIANAIESSALEREHELTRACIMAWAYERDMTTGLDLRGAPGGADGLVGTLQGTQILNNKSTPWINQIKGKTDVVTDQMLQNLPTLAIRTANARFEDLRMHEIRSAALNAVMLDPDAQQALYMWTRDGLIKRMGFIRCMYQHGRLELERLQPWQVYYDARDAMKGKISQVHVVHLVDREEFLSWYEQAQTTNDKGKAIPIPGHSEKRERIREIPVAQDFLSGIATFRAHWLGAARWLSKDHTRHVTDQIRIVWSYKRAWRAGEPTGRVTCTVLADDRRGSVVAIDAKFRRSTLPVVSWAPWRADVGITGIGLAEQLLGAQMVADQLLFKITRLQQQYGHPKFLYQKGDLAPNAIKALLNAGVFPVEFGGEAPVTLPGMVLSASDITLLNLVLDRPAAEQGITPGLTQGQSQLGPAASGVARIEEVFRSLDRQQGPRDAHTRGYRRLGEETLNCQDDALVIDKGYRARWPTKVAGQFRERPYAELRLDNGTFWIDVEERGVLGTTRAGKLQKAGELFAQGQINANTYREVLYTSPDLAAAGALEIAPRRAIESHLDALVDPKTTDEELAQIQPTEAMDLADAVFLTTARINQAIAQGASDETRDRLDGYLLAVGTTTQALAARAAQAAAAVAPVPPGPPEGGLDALQGGPGPIV